MNPVKLIIKATLLAPTLLLPTLGFALDPPKERCAGIQWSTEFLHQYPKAPVACREVTVKDGVKYAMFMGKVSKVDSQMVNVEVSNVAGTPISTIGFQVGVGGRVTINGVEKKVKDLQVSDDLTFWVEEGQFGISPTLAVKPIPIVKPKAMTD